MFDESLRRIKDQLGAPLAMRMGRVSPTLVSAFTLAVGLVAVFSAAHRLYLLSLGFWLLNRTLDGLDGLLARTHNRQSDLGGYVDILADFAIYALLPIGIVAGARSEENYRALAFMLAVFYVNAASWMYLAAILEKLNVRRADTQTTVVMPAGIIGGFETIVAYGVFLLFPVDITILFFIFSGLVIITILQRLTWAYQKLE
jgi:phosphatidylglycerophosphate synthase